MSDPALPRVTRILASAGSGKTFALTSRYLELVAGGEDPSRILATTFSRAAAAEIQARVLRRAALAVLGADKRRELAKAIGRDEQSFDVAEASRLLERVVRAIPRIQIRTLDSFFAGIVTAFATELGLNGVPRLLDAGEERTVLLEAIRLAMEEEDEQALLQTILSLAKGRHVAAVVRTAEDEVEDLLGLTAEATDDAFTWPISAATQEDAILRIRDELRASEKVDVGDSRFAATVAKDTQKLERALRTGGQTWSPMEFSTLAQRAARGEPLKFHRATITGDPAQAYRDLGSVLLRETASNYARMTASMRTLAVAIAARRLRHTRAQGLASFSDLTALLDPRGQHQPDLDEVWFRLDGRVRHLLLDEFQDTNVVQWRALQRLVEEIVAGGEEERSLFVVGDVKQAIYGWRGGEPRLLAELPQLVRDLVPDVGIDGHDLRVSYRSSKAVIDFVNLIFGSLVDHHADDTVERDAVRGWATRFAPHSTERKGCAGSARLLAIARGDRGNEDRALLLRVLRDEVTAARARRPDASIGVIVRGNKMVAAVVRTLQRDGHAVRVVGNGALLDREAPLCVLQALRLAEWPHDTVAAFDLATSPLAAIVGLDGAWDGTHWSAGDDGRGAAASTSRTLRRLFQTDGVAATVDRWRSRLGGILDDHEALRLQQLVAVLARLESSADRTPGEIAELAMQARVEHAAGGEIAVMNVHQSKGLEFDLVFVTDLEGKLEGGRTPNLAFATPPRPTDPIPRVVRWIPQELRPALPAMGAVCDDARRRRIEESISVLYVALTRARDELTVLVSGSRIDKKGEPAAPKSGRFASLLMTAVVGGPVLVTPTEGMRVLHEIGAQASSGSPASSAPTTPAAPTRLRVISGSSLRRRARPASHHATREELFRLPDRDSLDRGTAFHAALATIEWLSEVDPQRELLVTAIGDALPHRLPAWTHACAAEVLDALARQGLRALLLRESPACEARNEYRFLHETPSGLTEGSIDRLVLQRDDGGRVVAAEVIDYETDEIAPASLGILVTRHAAQLAVYRDVVAAQFGLEPAAIRATLFSIGVDRAVDVPLA